MRKGRLVRSQIIDNPPKPILDQGRIEIDQQPIIRPDKVFSCNTLLPTLRPLRASRELLFLHI